MRWSCLAVGLALAAVAAGEKRKSVFPPHPVIERARAVAEAERWRAMADHELRELVFGPRITRSHMVWSSGYCPACRARVPMYDWEIDAWARPWKVRCPKCNELFPKNDFEKFHRSGLDEQGVFEPKRADRSLLFNQEHPDPADPKHKFGVDDGEGYVEDGHRWRFIGAYLLYGQWNQKVEAGITKLAEAYVATGDPVYARKAGVLLDRVADLWPMFDYASQGLVYERARYGGGVAGYVFYAITSAYNVMHLVTAYDQVFDGLRDNPPAGRSFAEVQRNIEDRILRHVLDHPHQIRTNFPGTERTLTLIRTVLGWPANRAEILANLDEIVRRSTAVDGLSGEKGLDSYAAIAPRSLAEVLEQYARLDPALLAELVKRNPKLREAYRFHVDTWVGRRFYPHSGDAGSFGAENRQYAGLLFNQPGVFGFLWRMGEATGDPLYAQLAWLGNGGRAEGLEHAAEIRRVVEREGEWPRVGSVDKREWKIAILRHSSADDAAVWLDYDSVPEGPLKSHYHFDAMNLGLYARGLDLLPEFGYPAVQFGDWHTPQALWHKKTAAHNTVLVDGRDQRGGASQTTLWSRSGPMQVVRASSPGQYGGKEYERTVALIETGPRDFYVFDVFRVEGGREHAKFTHTALGEARPFGVKLQAAQPDFGAGVLMRGFAEDRQPAEGWGVDWRIGQGLVHLRYLDLTRGAEALTAESWTVRSMTSTVEYWVPTVIARRRAAEGELSSTFVSILDPYEGAPQVKRATRRDREGAAAVEVEVELADGRRDRIVAGPREVTFRRVNR